MKDILPILPQKLAPLVRELISYIIVAIWKRWYLGFISLVLIVVGFRYFANYPLLSDYFSLRFISATLILISLVSVAWEVLTQRLNRTFPLIAIYGCYSITDNKYISFDLESERLEEQIESKIEFVRSNLLAYKKYLNIGVVSIPKPYPILLGYKGLNTFVEKRVVKHHKHLATLHFLINREDQMVSPVFYCVHLNLTSTGPTDSVRKLMLAIGSKRALYADRSIDLITRIYTFIFSQSFIQTLIDNGNMTEVHFVLNDAEKQIKRLQKESEALEMQDFKQFCNFWISYIERYKAIVLIRQEQFSGAVTHLFNSISVHPFYPYEDYDHLKEEYGKRYAVSMLDILENPNIELVNESEQQVISQHKARLQDQMSNEEMGYNHELLKEILIKNNSKEMVSRIYNELANLDESNAFLLIIKSEIVRLLKKGEEKLNDIYVERFDETIDLLRKALVLDPNFPLINTKIGALLFLKATHYNDEILLEESLREYLKGQHALTELGFESDKRREA